MTKAEGDVRKVIERLAKTTCGDCLSTPCPHCAYLSRFGMTVADALTSHPAPSGWQPPPGPSIEELRTSLRDRIGAIARRSDGGNKGVQCVDCGEWSGEHHDHCQVVFYRDLLAVLDALPPAPEADPIASAVRAELQPLEDALIDAGHKLAKDATPDTRGRLCILPVTEAEREEARRTLARVDQLLADAKEPRQ
jgi:hypothetical protein